MQLRESVLTRGYGVEAVIDFVNNEKTASDAVMILRKRGKIKLVVAKRVGLDT